MRPLVRACLAIPNALFRRSSNWRRRPVLIDAAICPELLRLDQNFAIIQDEFRRAVGIVARSPRYHEVDPVQYAISRADDARSWRAFFLEAMGRKFVANRRAMPVTSQLIDGIPNVFQAFISRLDPKKSIPIHSSPYEGYLRYHLPLEVPREKPPYMIVGGVEVHWTEGKGVMFDDTFPHLVVNDCDEPRTVLIVDVARPMDAAGRAASKAVVAVLRHTYARRIEKRLAADSWTV